MDPHPPPPSHTPEARRRATRQMPTVPMLWRAALLLKLKTRKQQYSVSEAVANG